MRFRLSALIVLVLAAGPTAAEPISWSYAVTFAGDHGSSDVTNGFGNRHGERFYTGYTHLTPAVPPAGMKGAATVRLGMASGSGFIWTNAGHTPLDSSSPAFDPGFVAGLTITDAASGESALFRTSGFAQSADSWLGLPAQLALTNADSITQTIGSHVYQVDFRVGGIGQNAGYVTGDPEAWVDAAVSVTDAPAATPEPTTLVLAGLGLAGLLARRRLGRVGR